MSIKDRLQMIIKMNNLSNASFADRVGVQRSSISHIMAGRNKPSLDFIQKTLLAFPRVNAQWLITGEQSTVNDSVTFKEESSEKAADVSEVSVSAPKTEDAKQKEIDKIVVFFTDGTYTETTPSNSTMQ